MRAGAPSLNPRGRPPVGESLANALRSRFPPDRIAELAEKLATTADSEQVRLSALQLIAERAHGKVTTTIDASVSNGSESPTRDWSALSIEDRRDLLARLRAVPELVE